MNRRERLEAKVEKRREWAESRRKRSEAGFAKAARIADGIPFGQPILVGHHSERHARRDAARIESGMREGCESAKMANHHTGKAAGLIDQLDSSIFSDDTDAIEALEARIAEREAERDRIKAYNASCRKAAKTGGVGDSTLLDEKQRADILTTARVCAYQIGPGGSFPAYALANLSGRIKADRDRLEQVKRRQARQAEAEAAGGVTIKRHPEHNWAVVTFADRPEREVIDALKTAAYRWGAGSWQGYLDRLPECVAALCPAEQPSGIPG